MDNISHTSSRTSARLFHPRELVQDPLPQAPAFPRPRPIDIAKKVKELVKNPLFLVIVTWLVMAGLLLAEIVGGS